LEKYVANIRRLDIVKEIMKVSFIAVLALFCVTSFGQGVISTEANRDASQIEDAMPLDLSAVDIAAHTVLVDNENFSTGIYSLTGFDTYADNEVSIDTGVLTLGPATSYGTVVLANQNFVENNSDELNQQPIVLDQSPGPIVTEDSNVYDLLATRDATEQPPSGLSLPPIVLDGGSVEISAAPEPSPLAIALMPTGLALYILRFSRNSPLPARPTARVIG
jgi:hypothetical protein